MKFKLSMRTIINEVMCDPSFIFTVWTKCGRRIFFKNTFGFIDLHILALLMRSKKNIPTTTLFVYTLCTRTYPKANCCSKVCIFMYIYV